MGSKKIIPIGIPFSKQSSRQQGFTMFLISLVIVIFGFAIWRLIEPLSTQLQAAIVAAIATVLISVFSVLYAKYKEQQIAIRNEHRKIKAEVYEDLIDKALGFILNTPKDKKEEVKKLDDAIEYFKKTNAKFVIWGGDDFIKNWLEYTQASVNGEGQSALVKFEKVMFAIRKELGHDDRNLKDGDLLKIFIKDHNKVDEYLSKHIAN